MVTRTRSKLMDCIICTKKIEKDVMGWEHGHNAWPVKEGRCCEGCNTDVVLMARLIMAGHYNDKPKSR